MELDDSDIRRLNSQDEAANRLDDFAAELSGTKSGYMYRTSATDCDDSRSDIRAKKARKAEAALSALQQLLNDPEYEQAYGEARQTIDDFRERMRGRLAQFEQRIDAVDQKLENHAPGSPEHKRLIKDREGLQRRQQDVLDYYNDNVRPFDKRMDDTDDPLSKDELDGFNERVKSDMEKLFETDLITATEKSVRVRPEIDIKLPTLG